MGNGSLSKRSIPHGASVAMSVAASSVTVGNVTIGDDAITFPVLAVLAAGLTRDRTDYCRR